MFLYAKFKTSFNVKHKTFRIAYKKITPLLEKKYLYLVYSMFSGTGIRLLHVRINVSVFYISMKISEKEAGQSLLNITVVSLHKAWNVLDASLGG